MVVLRSFAYRKVKGRNEYYHEKNKTVYRTTALLPAGCNGMHHCAGRIHPEKLITHRFRGLDGVEPALALMKDKPRDLIKPVVIM